MGNAGSCPVPPELANDPVPLFSNGNINFKAHDVGWLLSGILALVAVCTSLWLILKHLAFFYCPSQQRHIVRILFMVPINAITSFLSYIYYNQALYFQLGRDCYEAIVIASFFHLLLTYLSSPPPTIERPTTTRAERAANLREVSKGIKIKSWMFPFGSVKWRPGKGGDGEGEGFMWLMRIGIGQYVIIRPLSTLTSVISEALGYYCLSSWSPRYFHVYMSLLVSISVSIAMYCVLQLYMPLKKELAPYRPVMKFVSVKAVIFFSFWQETFLSVLILVGVIKDREYWSATEIAIGLSAFLSCFEMMCFAFIHIKAFTYLPYRALALPLASSSPLALPLPDERLPKSFSAWSKWEARQAATLKSERRLEKIPSSSSSKEIRTTKEDGSPVLRQTRKWAALLVVLNIGDILVELGEEGKHVVKRRRKHGTDGRHVDMEAALGRRRETRGMGMASERAEDDDEDYWEQGEQVDLEKDLVRLRERSGDEECEYPRRAGVDGRSLPRNHVLRSDEQHQGRPLLSGGDNDEGNDEGINQQGVSLEGDGRPPVVEPSRGWWRRMFTSKEVVSSPSNFYQLERRRASMEGDLRQVNSYPSASAWDEQPVASSGFQPPSTRLPHSITYSAPRHAPPFLTPPLPTLSTQTHLSNIAASIRSSTPDVPFDIPHMESHTPRPISLPPPHRIERSSYTAHPPSRPPRTRRHSTDPASRIVAPSHPSSTFSTRPSQNRAVRYPTLSSIGSAAGMDVRGSRGTQIELDPRRESHGRGVTGPSLDRFVYEEY